jgi:hypothetical protein
VVPDDDARLLELEVEIGLSQGNNLSAPLLRLDGILVEVS